MFGNAEMTQESLRPRPRPEKFENAASFLRLDFPSNLIKNDFVIIIISFPCPSFPQTHIWFLRFQISLAQCQQGLTNHDGDSKENLKPPSQKMNLYLITRQLFNLFHYQSYLKNFIC